MELTLIFTPAIFPIPSRIAQKSVQRAGHRDDCGKIVFDLIENGGRCFPRNVLGDGGYQEI